MEDVVLEEENLISGAVPESFFHITRAHTETAAPLALNKMINNKPGTAQVGVPLKTQEELKYFKASRILFVTTCVRVVILSRVDPYSFRRI